MAEPIFVKLGMSLLGNGSGLGKIVAVETNAQATIEELLDASFSMRFVLYQGKLGN
jgi:hypothetical protein